MNQKAFEIFPVLETERLSMRKLTQNNESDLVEILTYRNSKDLSISGSELIEELDEEYTKKQLLNWGLFLENQLIGTCGFYRGFKDDIGEIGYVMREDYRGMGYMKEAIKRIIDFGFNNLCLKEIQAFTKFDNIRSQKLLEVLSFQKSFEKDDYWVYSIKE